MNDGRTSNSSRTLSRHVCRGLVLVVLLLFPVSSLAADHVRLQLKWHHQFQFAGYYAAKAQGYYEAAELDVEILPSQPGENPEQQVMQGKAEFGIGATDLLLWREKGVPVVVLASIFQHSPLAFMVLKRDGIQTVHDLVGAKVMMEPDSAELLAYLRGEGIAANRVSLLPHTFDVRDLLSGKVDAMSVYVTTEPFLVEETGRDYMLYSPRAAGIDFYSDNLFTTEAMLKAKPEVVKKFREASLKGWDYAMCHQEELVQLIHGQYSQERSLEHLRFEAGQMGPLLQASIVEIGHMNPGRWRSIADVYADMGMLRRNFSLEGFLYDTNPPPPDLTWLYRTLVGALSLLVIAILVAIRFVRLSTALREKFVELSQAHDQIKTLRGIVPICMHCKKIRDDQGYWNQVEVYVAEHTEADFSHGLCPECMKSLYAEFADDEDDQEDQCEPKEGRRATMTTPA